MGVWVSDRIEVGIWLGLGIGLGGDSTESVRLTQGDETIGGLRAR